MKRKNYSFHKGKSGQIIGHFFEINKKKRHQMYFKYDYSLSITS